MPKHENAIDVKVGEGAPNWGDMDQEKIAQLRDQVQSNIGRITVAMMNVPRYRHQSLSDLTHLVLDPLVRDKIIMAKAKASDDAASEQIAGFAIWASVSEEVAGKIREQIKAGVFPTKLQPGDWSSGDAIWLLDIIAPNQQLGKAVLGSFKSIAGDKPISIHPVVAQAVGKDVIEAMKVQPSEEDTVQ